MGLHRSEQDIPTCESPADARIVELYDAFRKVYDAWKKKEENLRELRRATAREAGLYFDDANALHDALIKDQRMTVTDFLDREREETLMLEQRQCAELEQEVESLRRLAGRIANDIFSMPADTVCGITPKLKILRLAIGRHGAQEDGDEDFEAYQETAPEPWLDSVLRDVERLAGDRMSGGSTPSAK